MLVVAAKQAFHEGNISYASNASQSVLDHQPNHPEATLILGASLIKENKFKKAVKLFEKARKKGIESPALYFNLGLGYTALKNFKEAIKSLKKCARMGMTTPDVYNPLAHAYAQVNNTKDALDFYIKSLAANKNQPAIIIKTAQLFIQTRQNSKAVEILNHPIDLSGALVQEHEERLKLLRKLSQKRLLEKYTQSLLNFEPQNALANAIIAELYEQSNKINLATSHYLNSAKSYFSQQDITHTEKFITKAAGLANNDELIIEDIGVLYMKLENYDKAQVFLQKALSCNPRNPVFNFNLGILFLEIHHISSSIKALLIAKELQADFLPCYLQLAKAYQLAGMFEEALECYNHVISVDEHHSSAHFDRARLMLAYGRISEAWTDYEWRIEDDTALSYLLDPRDTNNTLPKPSSILKEKNWKKRPFILLHDQGLGDILFFLRFATAMIAAGINFRMIMPDKIKNIIKYSNLDCIDIERIQDIPKDGILLSDSDLPLFHATISAEQTPVPLILKPETERVNRLKTTLAQLAKPPYIAVTWEAGTPGNLFKHSLHKYIDPYLLGKTLADTAGTIINIQRNPKSDDLEKFHQGLGRQSIYYSAINEDLDDMLALLSIIDDYVGVSNTNMHLRASLQKPAKILVPFPGEWRWMANGSQSPWFPDFKIYRESLDDAWMHALDTLKQDLSNPVPNPL